MTKCICIDIYTYFYRSIEEKECRMINFGSSSSIDPYDPRHRAAFYVDLIVIADEGEENVNLLMCIYVYKYQFIYL